MVTRKRNNCRDRQCCIPISKPNPFSASEHANNAKGWPFPLHVQSQHALIINPQTRSFLRRMSSPDSVYFLPSVQQAARLATSSRSMAHWYLTISSLILFMSSLSHPTFFSICACRVCEAHFPGVVITCLMVKDGQLWRWGNPQSEGGLRRSQGQRFWVWWVVHGEWKVGGWESQPHSQAKKL